MKWGGGLNKSSNDTNLSKTQTYILNSQIVSVNKFDQATSEIDGSVVMISDKELQDLQIRDTQDLSKIFPGFVIDSATGPGYVKTSIRGISSTDWFNPPLTVYVDGIPQDPQFISQELLDVKRIELLRGPQGTIWGQNAQAGVLNIVTNSIVSNTPRLHANSSIGNLSKNFMLSASTPLINDWLYIGGSVAYRRFSGMIKKSKTKESADTSDSLSYIASIALAPKDSRFSALFKYSINYLLDHSSGFLLNNEEYKTLEVADDREIPLSKRNMQTYALKLGYNVGKTSINGVFSYQSRDYNNDQLIVKRIDTRDAFTNELRLNTQYNNGAYSIFGIYYQYFKNEGRVYRTKEDNPSSNIIIKNTLAMYAEGKIPLFYDFDATIGSRYSYDYSHINLTGIKNLDIYTDNYHSHTFTPKIALGYNLNQDIRFYVLYQYGYKPGGFDYNAGKAASQGKILPEYAQNFELGVHSSFYQNRVFLDATLYYIYTNNKQIYVGIPPDKSLENAGNADSKGLELNFRFIPLDTLKFSFGGTFGRSQYIQRKSNLNSNKLIKGGALSYAPDITLNANIDYLFMTLNKAKFFLNLNTNFYSTTYFDEDEKKSYQPPYTISDGSIRVEFTNTLSIDLYIQNILNQKYLKYSRNFGGNSSYVIGNLMNIGISLHYQL